MSYYFGCYLCGRGGIEKIKKENTGDAHYNLFNMKAYNGADDAAQAASEGGWTTPSSCVQGSMAYFKEFIDNGQTTLFAFDWNWNKNENEEKGMHQYATLVNDAEEKALMMTIRDWVELDLHQPFTFTIPVFENVPSYSEDEEFVPYPDPAWE